MSMIVEPVNEYMAWTRYGRYDKPVLVVFADAPPEQQRFAEDFAMFGTHRVLFERK